MGKKKTIFVENELLGALCTSFGGFDVLYSLYYVARSSTLALRFDLKFAHFNFSLVGINVQSLTQMACDAR
jgi:hypothetical protein